MELLLANVSGYSTNRCLGASHNNPSPVSRHSEGKTDLGVYTHWTTLRQAKARTHNNQGPQETAMRLDMTHGATYFECLHIACCVSGASGLDFSELSFSSYERVATLRGCWEHGQRPHVQVSLINGDPNCLLFLLPPTVMSTVRGEAQGRSLHPGLLRDV